MDKFNARKPSELYEVPTEHLDLGGFERSEWTVGQVPKI